MNPVEYLLWKALSIFHREEDVIIDDHENTYFFYEDEIIELILTVVHNANAVLKKINGEKHEELADMESARRAGMKAAIKNALITDTTPEQSHINWLAAQEALGYKYGVSIDRINLLHPCMVPYDQLPEAQKLKDDLFMSIINSFRGVYTSS